MAEARERGTAGGQREHHLLRKDHRERRQRDRDGSESRSLPVQSGGAELDLGALGIDPHAPYQMHDALTGSRYLSSGARNYVSLDPQRAPTHIFRLRRRVRSGRDFDYFL